MAVDGGILTLVERGTEEVNLASVIRLRKSLLSTLLDGNASRPLDGGPSGDGTGAPAPTV